MQLTLWSPAIESDEGTVEDAVLARPFGTGASDILVDLWHEDPEEILSALLSACLTDLHYRSFTKDEIESWTLKRRMQGLLAIAVATAGGLWAARQRCPADDCGEVLELELPLTAFRSDWRGETLRCTLTTGESLDVRRPTAADLRRWATSGETAPQSIAECLLGGEGSDRLRKGWVGKVEAALEADDPTGNLQLEMTCPSCGTASIIDFPLQDFLLAHLKRRGQALLDEVHCLASIYHWSEAEILALPPDRRHFYLARICEELGA
jgi:hypothetical protein